jgi:crossover junction endodeoxyribonuclease RuvC
VTAIAGIDGATKDFGLACPDGVLLTLNARAGSDQPIRRLAQLEDALYMALVHHPPRATLFVVEGYLLHGPGALALARLGEVGGMVRTMAFRLGAHVVEVGPTQLKRFATGNGAARKPAMVARANELGADTDDHNQADAFLLRYLGRMGCGDIAPTFPHEAEVVAALTWPVLGRVA